MNKTPIQKENEELKNAGWVKVGRGKYESPNSGATFNRRVAIAMARKFSK